MHSHSKRYAPRDALVRYGAPNPLASVLRKVSALSATGDVDTVALARVIEEDTDLASSLIRAANASTARLGHGCRSVQHATALLGVKRVTDTVTAQTALRFLEAFASRAPRRVAHYRAVAELARTLAPRFGVSAEAAFLAGLLHDVGSLAVEESGTGWPDVVALRGAIGARVLREWGLPEVFSRVAETHHDWCAAKLAGREVLALVATVQTSSRLLAWVGQDEPAPEMLHAIWSEDPCQHFGITRAWLWERMKALRATGAEAGAGSTRALTTEEASPRPVSKGARALLPEDVYEWLVLILLAFILGLTAATRLG